MIVDPEHLLIEDPARHQLKNMASLLFIHKHVAAMPDVHWDMKVLVNPLLHR
nr:hypothetical protein [Brevundimonas diminuta]